MFRITGEVDMGVGMAHTLAILNLTLCVLVPLFILFSGSQKCVGGLICEGYAVLGTLRSNCVEEKGGCLGSFTKYL